jgi:hypothetical protein
MPFAEHNHKRVRCEASGRDQRVWRRRCDDGKVELVVLKFPDQLKRIRRNNLDGQTLVQAQLDAAQDLDQIWGMTRRNSDMQPMGSVVLGFLRFMHGPPKRLYTFSRMGNKRASRSSGNNATVATLEETGLNSPFDLSELFTESWFAHPQALGGLSHIALFMQGNDQFEIADSELAFRHDVSPATHTNPCASPRQAGRPHDWSLIPPGNDGQLKSVLYNPRPYLLQFDTLIEI